ncbi:ABC-2 type transport system ATP-binding protein [Lachnospiraceae bacterium RM5]|nr:ABC-2 type transport system ATP-binding protein [Lachnospiraceae bacterium RM5]
MSTLVSIKGVKKGYGVKKIIFEDLNLEIESGKIVGLLGPNGSGKTTLIKMLAGILSVEKGKILINGNEIGVKSKSEVAYLSERIYFNESLKVKQVINLYKDFFKDFDEDRALEMFKNLNIDINTTIKKLSKGNKEKVQLIMVMSRRAKLYLLDEPIAGVDPAARDFILHTILKNYDSEATILISTHLITDVEEILDEVIFIREGKILLQENADKLRQEKGQSINEVFREVFKSW